MTAFLIVLALGGLALSLGATVAGARWALRQVNIDDCPIDLEDFC